MKTTFIFLLFSLLLISCERDNYLIPRKEVPDWLKTQIARDEKEIKDDPKSGKDIGAWFRYEYKGEYYFEYENMISSAFPPVYYFNGNLMNTYEEPYIDYMNKKCCKQIVWKGKYFTIV